MDRSYLGDTAILQTRFISQNASVLLTDFFVIARKRRAHFYDFVSLHSTRKLVRLLRLEKGTQASVQVRISARPDYTRGPANWKRVSGGFACRECGLFSNIELQEVDDDLTCTLELVAGETYFVVLDYGETPAAPLLNDVERCHSFQNARVISNRSRPSAHRSAA